jgi:hypothetical protein
MFAFSPALGEFWLYKLLLRVWVKTSAALEARQFGLGGLLVAALDSLDIGATGQRSFDAEKAHRMC